MDKKNLEILKILQKKARIPNVEVSRLINMAPSAVLERIRKLENQGVIDGYEVRLNPERFNCRQVSFIRIFLESEALGSDIAETLSTFEEIQEVHFIAGDDCLLVKTRTADTQTLDTLLREKILPIRGISSTRTTPVLSTWKETANIPIRLK